MLVYDAIITFNGRQYVAVPTRDADGKPGLELFTRDTGIPIAEQLLADMTSGAEVASTSEGGDDAA